MASNMKRDEPDKKFNEEFSLSVECSTRGSHHSESTETLTAPKSKGSSSYGNYSSFLAIRVLTVELGYQESLTSYLIIMT